MSNILLLCLKNIRGSNQASLENCMDKGVTE